MKINEQNIHNIVRSVLKEYSADQRLPFDDDKFKNKNYFEQYTDWLEDFGKYGTLPPSKLNFWDEAKKAIKEIKNKNLHGRFDFGISDKSDEEILKKFAGIIGNYLIINESNNIYVERAVKIYGSANDYDDSEGNDDPRYLFRTLVNDYQNNVGGCWSYKMNGSYDYCSYKNGASIIMKGYIRVEDIDFVKTILLNFYYRSEHEIRVKPNSKIELFEVIFDCKYKVPLKKHLIVNATYFGNNSGYMGDYASVDDGFGNLDYMDRKGNIIKNEDFMNLIQKRLLNGESPKNLFEHVMPLENGLTKVSLFKKWSLIGKDGKLIGDGKLWFDWISDFYKNFAPVKLNGKASFIDSNGKLFKNGAIWFNNVQYIENDFFKVWTNGKYSLFNDKFGLIGDGKLWFDDIKEFVNGFIKVVLNDKYSFINSKGNLIGNGNEWFDNVDNFSEGFAAVKLNKKWSFIDANGNLIGNGKMWFDWVVPFGNGFGTVHYNGYLYSIDKNGTLKKIANWDQLEKDIDDTVKESISYYLKNK